MKLLLDRKYKKDTYTIGILYIDGIRFSETIEDADRGLSDSMPEAEIKKLKKYGVTAIPTGTYEVKLTYSPKYATRTIGKKYGGKVPQVMNVKGYQGIRIHPGNTAEDSLGCILPGKNLEKGKVLQSTATYYNLMDKYLVPATKKGEKITITIK